LSFVPYTSKMYVAVQSLLFDFRTVGSTVGNRISLICTVGRDSG
jgi:hypothetical protein